MADLQKKRGSSYRPVEDEALIKAWKLVTGDATVGSDQTSVIFWKKVGIKTKEFLASFNRADASCKSRFGTIQRSVNIFIQSHRRSFDNLVSRWKHEEVNI